MENVTINLVWDPPWRPDFMTEEARVSLGYPI
jgi:metal-sulfur cluster biosynthetic enzyme